MDEQSGVQPPAEPQGPQPERREPALTVPPELALGNRYIAAWGEINARIHGRDNIILTFVIVAVTIIGVSLASDDPELAQRLPLAVPYTALVLTQLWTAHDLLIGFLSAHLGDVAREAGPIKKWDWHVGTTYRRGIYWRRAFMYGGQVLAVILLCGLALYTSWKLSERSLERERRTTTYMLRLPPVVSSHTLLEKKVTKDTRSFESRDTLFTTADSVVVERVERQLVKQRPRELPPEWWMSAIVAIAAVVQTLIVFYIRIMGVEEAARKAAEAQQPG